MTEALPAFFNDDEELRDINLTNFTITPDPEAPKYTQRRVEVIVDCLKKGMSVEGATGLAGISRQLYYDWKERYLEFDNLARAARAHGEMTYVDMAIADQGYKFMLARRYRDDYGDKVEVDGEIIVQIRFVDEPEE